HQRLSKDASADHRIGGNMNRSPFVRRSRSKRSTAGARLPDRCRWRVLCVENSRLPDNDYRVLLPSVCPEFDMMYGLPERPSAVDASRYVRVGFREGLRIADIGNFARLFYVLVRLRRQLDTAHF